MNSENDIVFLAEAVCVAQQMRNNSSMFYCQVIQGEICKGDSVQILDENKQCIVEQKISSIQHSKFPDKVKKGDNEEDIVYLVFYHIYQYPLKNAAYILKVNGGSTEIKEFRIQSTDLHLRKQLLQSDSLEQEVYCKSSESSVQKPDIAKRIECMQREAVVFRIDVLGDTHIKYEEVMHWINSMLWFKPNEMSFSCNGYRARRFNEKTFEALLRDTLKSGERFSIFLEENCEPHPFGMVSVEYDTLRTCFSARIQMDTYILNSQVILDRFEKLFIHFNGLCGYLENNFDVWARSCLNSEYALVEYGFSTVGVEYTYPNSFANGNKAVNPHCLPWHVDEIKGIPYYACYGMWFGPAYYEIFPEEKVAGFKDCAENIALGNGFRRIFLYDDIMDCNAVENRRRQWSFRKHLDMCETIRKLNLGPLPPAEAYATGRDPYSEIFTEGSPFPHGGDRYAKVYTDNNGKTCPKSKAAGYMYVEYKDNAVIFKEKVPFDEQA